MFPFAKPKDSLDEFVISIIRQLLEKTPKIVDDVYSVNGVKDKSHQLPRFEEFLDIKYFSRPTLVMRLLFRSISMHLINSIREDDVLAADVPYEDRENPQLL